MDKSDWKNLVLGKFKLLLKSYLILFCITVNCCNTQPSLNKSNDLKAPKEPYEWAKEEDFQVDESVINFDLMNGIWVSKSDPLELTISKSKMIEFSKLKVSKLNFSKANSLGFKNYEIEPNYLSFVDEYDTHYIIHWPVEGDYNKLILKAQHSKHKGIRTVEFEKASK